QGSDSAGRGLADPGLVTRGHLLLGAVRRLHGDRGSVDRDDLSCREPAAGECATSPALYLGTVATRELAAGEIPRTGMCCAAAPDEYTTDHTHGECCNDRERRREPAHWALGRGSRRGSGCGSNGRHR